MKAGDRVFIHHAHSVSIYATVEQATDEEIVLWVINGAYELKITKANPPTSIRGDYNAAIDWFRPGGRRGAGGL